MSSYVEFIKAICDGNLEQVKILFHVDYLDKQDAFGEYAIHHACKNNNYVATVNFLLENQSDIESCNEEGVRPIHIACANGNPDIMKLLISYNCELECKTKDDKTPLQMIEVKNCLEILKEARANQPIVLAMNLKCEVGCNHKCCLSSVLSGSYDKDILIGHGRFANVYKLELESGQECAVKQIYYTSFDVKAARSVESDITNYLDKLSHGRIVRLIGAIKLKLRIDIYMEYMAGGSLEDQIRRNGALPHQDTKRYIKQILEGVAFLHEIKIIHRDIKPANILLDHNKDIKLGDFGYSILIESIINSRKYKADHTFCGTANYMAPEVIRNEPYGFASDIWSVGASTVHMLTGKPPYHNLQQNKLIFEIGNTKTIDFVPCQPISDEMETLVKSMLICPKENRPSAKVLLSKLTF